MFLIRNIVLETNEFCKALYSISLNLSRKLEKWKKNMDFFFISHGINVLKINKKEN